MEQKYYASSADPNRTIAELQARIAAMNEDQDQLRMYLAEANVSHNLHHEERRLDAYKLAEKDEIQVQMAYELNTAQEALHAAHNKWQTDNQTVTGQINAMKKEALNAEERAAVAFARDAAAHAQQLVSSQDDLTKQIASTDIVQKELNDQITRQAQELEILTATNAQSVRDYQVALQQVNDKNLAIVNLEAQISTSMEIDTDDTEVLKNRLAAKGVEFVNLEQSYAALVAVGAAQTLSINDFETARIATDAEIITQREQAIIDNMTLEDLKRKCEESEHSRALLITELEKSIPDPRNGGSAGQENPEVLQLVVINKKLYSNIQTLNAQIAKASRDLEDQAAAASATIVNWETSNLGLLQTITVLEDNLQDHAFTRAGSPERTAPTGGHVGTNLASLSEREILMMINNAISHNNATGSPHRGRSPVRYDISDEIIPSGRPPRETDDEVGGENNPEGDSYSNYEEDLNTFVDNQEPQDAYGAWMSSDPYGRWQPDAYGGMHGIQRYKEKDEVIVPVFPTGPGVTQWRMNIAKALANTSGRYDQKEINWFVHEGFGPGITFESLADSGAPRFRSIDMKLSQALGKVVKNANNALTIDLATIEEKLIEEGSMLMGRQIAWKIIMFFQTNPICELTYGISDLLNLPWQGDPLVANFLSCWRLILRKMRTKLSDEELGEVLYEKIKHSKQLTSDIAHYDRQPLNHPDRTYQFLLACMDRRIADAQMERNRANDKAAIRSGNVSGFGKMIPAVPAVGGQNPPGKKAQAKAAKALAASTTAEVDSRVAIALAAKGKGKGGKGAGSPTGKGDGKGKGKGKDFKQTPCWFFNCHANGCTKSAEDCSHQHKKLSKAEADKLVKPGSTPGAGGSGSRAASPSGKGKGDGKAQKKGPVDEWCHKFLTGNCKDEHCARLHLEPDVVKTILEKRKVAAAKAKAKAKP